MRGARNVEVAFRTILDEWPGFDFETRRLLVGDTHWQLDWTLKAELPGPNGPVPVRLECLDLVLVDGEGLISSKDTWVNVDDLAAIGERIES